HPPLSITHHSPHPSPTLSLHDALPIFHGVTRSLLKHNERIRTVAVEPAESAVLSGKPSGSHKIEGIGIGFVPPLWQPELVNDIQDRKSTRLNSSHQIISYAVFCLKKKK